MNAEIPTALGTTQNARVRYDKRVASLGTKAHIRKRIKEKKQAEKGVRKNRRARGGFVTQNQVIAGEIEEFLKNEGVEFLTEQIHDKSAQKAPLPSFPFIIFVLAVIKDIIDLASLTIIGMVLTKPLTFIIALILFLWFLGKMGGRWWKGKMLSWFWWRFFIAMGIESIAEVFPATTLLVLMAHFRETKTVKILNRALEALHSAKFNFKLD